jgi:hypothetical protein
MVNPQHAIRSRLILCWNLTSPFRLILHWIRLRVGVPRDIVSPRVVQVVIQEHGREQAELKGRARFEVLDDLPGAEVLFVGVGANEVEVELIGKGLGEEVAAAAERFQVEELIFD